MPPLLHFKKRENDPNSLTCSSWNCWSYSQKAGTIAGCALFVLGILFLLRWHFSTRTTNQRVDQAPIPRLPISNHRNQSRSEKKDIMETTGDQKKGSNWPWGLLAGWAVGRARKDRKKKQEMRKRRRRHSKRENERGRTRDISRSRTAASSSLQSLSIISRSRSRSQRRKEPPMLLTPSISPRPSQPRQQRRRASAPVSESPPLPFGEKAFEREPQQKLPQINIIPPTDVPSFTPPSSKVRTSYVKPRKRADTSPASLLPAGTGVTAAKMADDRYYGRGRRRGRTESEDAWRRGRLAQYEPYEPVEQGRGLRTRSPTPPRRRRARSFTPSPSPARRRRPKSRKADKKKRDTSPGVWRDVKWWTALFWSFKFVDWLIEPEGGWSKFHKKEKKSEEHERRPSPESLRRVKYQERRRPRDSLDMDERDINLRRVRRDRYSSDPRDGDGSTLTSCSSSDDDPSGTSRQATVGRNRRQRPPQGRSVSRPGRR